MPHSVQLDIGRAGEYLVMYDLISRGYKCFLTDQGTNYDLVIDLNHQLIRLQVKTTMKTHCMNKTYRSPTYLFNVRRAGKGGKRLYDHKEFEGFALVTMDTKGVYYYPFTETINKTLIFRDRRETYITNHGRIAPYIDDFTLDRFLAEVSNG